MTATATATQTLTLNCGHTYTHNLPTGQLAMPTVPGTAATCVPCWNLHGFEGTRYVVTVVNSDEH